MNGDEPRSVARSIVDHRYRRVLLALFDATEPPVSVRELARGVLVYEQGRLGTDGLSGLATPHEQRTERVESPENVETMAAQLHHVHLPLLDAAGVVQYDAVTTEATDWCHPNVGDRWVSTPPVDALVDVLRTSDAGTPGERRDVADEQSVSD